MSTGTNSASVKKTKSTGWKKIWGRIIRGEVVTPHGKKKIIPADWTASGSLYRPIERVMTRHVYGRYGNTHSNSHIGTYMHNLTLGAKEIVRKHFKCNDDDLVIPTGAGCTCAIRHLIHLLNLDSPHSSNQTKKVVIITSVIEHHSNMLPWKHCGCKHFELDVSDKTGLYNFEQLRKLVRKWTGKGYTVYVSLSACSNITGVLQDMHTVAQMVHTSSKWWSGRSSRQNGTCDGRNGNDGNGKSYIFWDCASCAPYVDIDMNKNPQMGDYFDAIAFSGHKWLGGPSSPGMLIVKKCVVKSDIPFYDGGGTVRFVCKKGIDYTPNIETRETGGTPNILGIIKMGLAVHLSDELGMENIERRENHLTHYIQKRLQRIRGVKIYNPVEDMNRLPIFIINIGKLHHNLVVALMSDRYGIQCRGGISCASLYAQKILRCDGKKSRSIHKYILDKKGVPSDYGFVRLSFHYSMPRRVVDYILNAVEEIAKHGEKWKAEYDYECCENNYNPKGFDWKRHNVDAKKLYNIHLS